MKAVLSTLLLCLLLGCGSEPTRPPPETANAATATALATVPRPDFSGYWEMDYGRSDNVDQKLQSMYLSLKVKALLAYNCGR